MGEFTIRYYTIPECGINRVHRVDMRYIDPMETENNARGKVDDTKVTELKKLLQEKVKGNCNIQDVLKIGNDIAQAQSEYNRELNRYKGDNPVYMRLRHNELPIKRELAHEICKELGEGRRVIMLCQIPKGFMGN